METKFSIIETQRINVDKDGAYDIEIHSKISTS